MTVGLLSFANNSSLYEGLVASRARMFTSLQTPQNQSQSRSGHVATEQLTSVRVAFANFYPVGTDTGPGATTTVKASIEYPAGTYNQLLFSSSPTGTISNGGVLFSDYVTLSTPIPNGATFWVRNLRTTGTAAILMNYWGNSFYSEATELSTSAGLTDKTMSGTIVDSGNGWSTPPLAILGMTVNPSIIIVGDSIARGFHDTEDSSASATGFNGKIGVIARSLGNVPFLNLAVDGENAYTWSTDATARNLLIQKGSHLLCELGLSDIINHARTAAQTLTALQSVYALARSGQKIYQATVTPHASDTGTPSPVFTTLGQQTALDNTERTTFNNAVRATLANTLGKIDVASVLESSLNSGLWTVTPSPPYPFDSPAVHPNPAGYLLVQNAGIMPAITWP